MSIGGIDSGRIESMLAQMRAAAQRPQTEALGGVLSPISADKTQNTGKIDFAEALKASLDQVNQTQQNAAKLSRNFALGDDSVSLSDVMIAGQKSSIAFQATIQVRNKLVSAYQDIMNMPV
ncbi:MAG: flagellar hook-basal body complex protein FliE [Betaproteobacteria bacterium HGW-Betaproteobacteria-22]|nr:MAG: flagellar hook-basal body complex protein FliE [Betaproteobacteria bacterium HGW-Betaproteobacteria-22]